MKYYKLVTKRISVIVESHTYILTVEDGYVSRCEPSNRAYLGMREDTLLYRDRYDGDRIELVDQPIRTYLITWIKDGETEMTVAGSQFSKSSVISLVVTSTPIQTTA